MTHSTEVSMIHQMADAMIDMLSYAQYRRIRTAAEKGGFDAGLKAITRVSQQIAAEKVAAAQDAAFQRGRLIGLQMVYDATPEARTPAPIARTAVESSMIKSIGFRQTTARAGTLEVEFADGAVYQYDEVLVGVYDDLMDARSIGAHFNHKIKPFYTARLISDAN
jgi:hypothetical protein